MGCNSCKEKTVYQDKPHNVVGNIGLRIIIFIVGAALIPIFIPFMWYFLFTKLFFETKHMDLINYIAVFTENIKEKRAEKRMMKEEMENGGENEYEDYQIYQVDEIDEKEGK
jgi:hypothetical protein